MKTIPLLVFISYCWLNGVAHAACDRNATTATFAAQLSASTAGQTICLATGDYGDFPGAVKSSPGVTITKAAAATPRMRLNFQAGGASWITFDNLTVYGISDWCGTLQNVTVQNSTMTGTINIWGDGPNNHCGGAGNIPANAHILFDNDLFNFADGTLGSFEGRFNLLGATPSTGTEMIRVQNSTFTGGCADGIDIEGGAKGQFIGPGNTFISLLQGGCGPHVDSIQFVGSNSPGVTIAGNFFNNDESGVAAYDNENSATVTNNVFINIAGGGTPVLGGGSWDNATVFSHNTIVGGNGNLIQLLISHEGNTPAAGTAINNISPDISNICPSPGSCGNGTPNQADYNWCTLGTCTARFPGTHDINGGSPQFVNQNLSTACTYSTCYAGFALVPSSTGTNAGSDGTDIGALITPNTTPTLTTTAATNITASTATSGGNISSDGGFSVTARGTCVSTSANPTTSDTCTSDGTGTGSFTSSITGRTAGTLYHIRAFATNSQGTAYGSDLTFTTLGPPTITESCPIAAGSIGIVYSNVMTAVGNPAPTWDISAGSLPAGLSISSGGTVSGTPTTAGSSSFTLRATNSQGNNTMACSMTISAAVVSYGGTNTGNKATAASFTSASQTVSGANPVWVVHVDLSSTTATVSSVTWSGGGGTPVQVKTARVSTDYATTWCIPAPTVGAGTISATFSTSVPYQYDAILYNNASQTTPCPTGDAVSSITSNLSNTLTPTNLGASDATSVGCSLTNGGNPIGVSPNQHYLDATTLVNLESGDNFGTGGVTCTYDSTGGSHAITAVRIAVAGASIPVAPTNLTVTVH